MYAEHRRGLLVILQGMDASGKDGTIRHVMTGLNPQGCRVTVFKAPSIEEADHDFLWRVHRAVPAKGEIVVKFFLHISKASRNGASRSGWTIPPNGGSSRRAPWYIVPADRKWVRNFAVSAILVETLEACRMKFPKPAFDGSRLKATL
jgi:polyphosphate kinase 2 (PPK2 family)